jgi:alpha-D-ribose 1-methylphosphonate 5-triphosphate synthase subunit PhnH
MDTVLDGGFADPVLQSQASFRAIMDALANPGTCQDLVTPQSISHTMSVELVSTLLTLSDHDTAIWLDNGLAHDNALTAFIGFHAGAPIVAEPGKAAFAFASAAGTLPALDQFNLGTQEYPDRSTTIVLAVPALTGGKTLVLRGPGIKDHRHISPTGLPEDFVDQWTANRDLFPRGIDLLLVANGQVMGLPRSTRMTEGH